jgi:hypothetical protein
MTHALKRGDQDQPFYPFHAATDEQAAAVAELLEWRVEGIERVSDSLTLVLVS